MPDPYRRAASVAKLCELKDVTPEMAEKVRAVWKADGFNELRTILGADYPERELRTRGLTRTDFQRERICLLLGYYGIEYLGNRKRGGNEVYCLNAGDTYAPTIAFDGDYMYVTTMGDLVESETIRQPASPF